METTNKKTNLDQSHHENGERQTRSKQLQKNKLINLYNKVH